MSHSNEPSYYEIALTNRQVLVVFVVLLICVIAAFFSGVWIGRESDQATIADLAEPAPEKSTVDAENGAVEELHFFTGESSEAKPSLAEVAEKPKPDTTLAEDIGVPEPQEAAGSEPAGSEAAETAELAAAPTSDLTEEVETRKPPKVAESKVPRQKPSETSGAPTAEGEHVIQVFSSADEGQAKKLISQLSGGGFPAFLSPVDVGGQTMYRVRIGPYLELADAETVAARVRRSYKLDTWVTR